MIKLVASYRISYRKPIANYLLIVTLLLEVFNFQDSTNNKLTISKQVVNYKIPANSDFTVSAAGSKLPDLYGY